MLRQKNFSFKASVFASLALAFSAFGDAFLYSYLPVQGNHLGIPVYLTGIVLSVNRFIRVFMNTFMVKVVAAYGLRNLTIFAVALAIFSTAGYAFAFGAISWIIFRICWGIAYAALRITSIGYALNNTQPGLSLGIGKSFQEAGPMIALLLAPFLLSNFDARGIFIILATISLPALYFSVSLPREFAVPKNIVRPFLFSKLPSSLNLITFGSAFLIDGMVVISLGIFFLRSGNEMNPLTATILAASYLAYRRVCLLVLSTVGGWLADVTGLRVIFKWSTAFTLAGLVVLGAGYTEAGAILIFTFYSVQSVLSPGTASETGKPSLEAVAENATWRDLGAAAGTLTGGFLITSAYLSSIILFATFVLVVLLFFSSRNVRQTIKLISWR